MNESRHQRDGEDPMADAVRAMTTGLRAAIAGATPGLEAVDALCRACVRLFDVDGAAVSLVLQGASWGTYGSSSDASRRIDEYQFTFGEGPCLDAVASRQAVLAPDLDSPREQRWPAFAGAVLDDGIRGVFALPIMVTSVCVGALDMFRAGPGPLRGDHLAGALLAAELASGPLLEVLAEQGDEIDAADAGATDRDGAYREEQWERLPDIDRIEVYQATGMLISQLDVDAAEALVRLRGHAIATGQTASQVAWAILEHRLVLERDDSDGAGRSPR